MGEHHAGYLVKEGAVVKSWKKRYFVLKNEELSYSKSNNTADSLGLIDIADVKSVGPVEYKKKKFCFALETPKRTYYLVADDEKTRDEWIQVLQNEADRINGRGKYAGAGAGSKGERPPSPRPGGPAAAAQPASTTRPGEPATRAPGQTFRVKAADKVGLQDFELMKVIGKGSFGKVFQVKKKDNGKIYALKVLQKKTILERKEVAHTRTEKNVLQRLVHPFLVNLYFFFQTPDHLCFVMDFVNGGELFSHLQANRKFPEERVRFYAAEILLGLEYLHNNGVLYRDLKPENLLLTEDGHICMTDFGIAKEGLMAANDRTATFCGTPEYLAPEILKGESYGKPIDWWSLGTLIFEMFTGSPPFYSTSVQTMYKYILERDPPYPADLSPQALSIMKDLLQRDPTKRLTDPKLIKQHAFFKGIDFDKLFAKELTPPYIPPVKSKDDVSMISREFLDLKVELDAPTGPASSDNYQKVFNDF